MVKGLSMPALLVIAALAGLARNHAYASTGSMPDRIVVAPATDDMAPDTGPVSPGPTNPNGPSI